MPKILINEKDRTSPGTPDRYANYAVLIAGLRGTPNTAADKDLIVSPDSNGAYEFTSAESFKATIGLTAPRQTLSTPNGDVFVDHYGNHMAYELLGIGYTVIYVPIAVSDIYNLGNDSFWEPFKDKANYDFRFISHGLLSASPLSADGEIFAQRLNDVNAAETCLREILSEAQKVVAGTTIQLDQIASGDVDLSATTLANLNENLNEMYANLSPVPEGFSTATGFYGSFADAAIGVVAEKTHLEATLAELAASGISNTLINNTNTAIAKLAAYVAPLDSSADDSGFPGRGDCLALIELDDTAYLSSGEGSYEEKIIGEIDKQAITPDLGKYCAATVPSVYYRMSNNEEVANNKKFPGAFHYLACFMNSLKLGFAEWYSAAGYTRGVSSYVVDNTTIKLGEIAINALEPRNNANGQSNPKFAVNVIANFRGSYYLWGNRTAHPLGKKDTEKGNLIASHFLNIRHLCTTIKKQLYIACRSFTFDPNSDTLWINFVNAIRPTLEMMKADQGIRDYKILKVYTDKKATLKAKIRIIPIEAVEDFDLEISLEDSFGETAVNAVETM